MHANPCGKAVDMARRPYTTDARFFLDSDQVVKIRWYPVAEPVECLDLPSKISSLDWCSHPWIAEGVGEVYGAARPYNGRKALPYARDLTPCEPAEVFRFGEPLDESRPHQTYNLDGFPNCCLNLWTPAGGIRWGGEAGVTVMPPPGAVCGSGGELDLGVWYEWVTSSGENPFWKWSGLTAGSSYRMRMIVTNPPPLPFVLGFGYSNGPACSPFVPGVNSIVTPSPCDEVRVLPAAPHDFINLGFFNSLWGGQVRWRFRVDPA